MGINDIQMDKMYEKCSMSLVIKKMQIKLECDTTKSLLKGLK